MKNNAGDEILFLLHWLALLAKYAARTQATASRAAARKRKIDARRWDALEKQADKIEREGTEILQNLFRS